MIARYSIAFFVSVAFIILPIVLFLICRRLLPKRYGRQVGILLGASIVALASYGMFWGFEELEVHQVEYASTDLPEAFDGYRIVHFSDAHVGTYEGRRAPLLQRMVDSINAQHADIILFTGDLQNLRPGELADKVGVLKQLHARDGVYSVLGNHDYATYLDLDEAGQERNNRQTCELERKMGWTLLLNEHRIVRRDSDSIVIAGMENWGKVKRMPRRGDVAKALAGLPGGQHRFTIMLQHDPSAWREKILPECDAQLTLSGHTHGGQFSMFGWSPVSLSNKEWGGMTTEGERAIYVSTGVGGLIPFRLGMPGEIAVITLKKKK